MNKEQKGQALVEFVIILPIFIFMIFTIIDLGKILYVKNNLENKITDVVQMYQKNNNDQETIEKLELDKEKIQLKITKDNQYITFYLKKKTEIITPGLNLIFKNPYYIETKRVIYNES